MYLSVDETHTHTHTLQFLASHGG